MATYTIYGRMKDGATSGGEYSTNGTTWVTGPYVQNLNLTNQDNILLYMRATSGGFPRQPNGTSQQKTIDTVDWDNCRWNNDYSDDGSEQFGGVPSTHSIHSKHNLVNQSGIGAYEFELNDSEKVGSGENAVIHVSNFRIQGTAFRDEVLYFNLGADFVNQTPGAACTRTVSPTGYVTGQLVVATGSATTSINGSTFNTSNKTVAVGGTVYVRVTASSSFSTTLTGGVTIGNGGNTESDSFTVTTVSQNTNVNTFSYTNVTGSNLNTTHIQSRQITGFTGILGVTQTGSVTFGISNSGVIGGSNPVTYGSTGNITSGQYLFVNLTSNNTYGGTVSGTVYVGPQANNESAFWSVTNDAQDTTPNPTVLFGNTSNANPSQVIEHYAQVTGIDAPSSSQPVPLTISGCEWQLVYAILGNYSVPTNYSNPSSIALDAPVRLYIRQTASSAFYGTSTASVKVGAGPTDTATVTTRAPDLQPNAFSLGASASGQARNTNFDRTATITGFETTLPVTISSVTGTASFKVNNGSFSTGTLNVSPGNTVTLRVTSSNSFSTLAQATLTVGTGSNARSASFGITTLVRDNTPVGWTVANVTNAQLNVQHYYIQQINGINDSVSVTATGTAGALFKTSASATYSASGYSSPGAQLYITNGQYLHVAISTASSYSTERNITTTVGTAVDTWRVTTRAATSIPNSYSFTNATNASPSSIANTFAQINGMESGSTQASIQSSSLAVSGTQLAVSSSTTIPALSSFTTSAVNINSGQYLHVRSIPPPTYATTSTVTIDVGGVDRTWSISTLTSPTGTGTTGGGQSGTAGANTHGLEIYTANGTEVFSSNLRNQSIAVHGTWSFANYGDSTTFTCADANDPSKILIIVRGAALTAFNTEIRLTTTSTGFTLTRFVAYAANSLVLSGTVLAVRIS